MERIVKIKEYLFYAAVLVLIFILGFCKTAVLTAPDNSTLVITVNPPVIPLGGQAVVRVVGFKASGTPVPDGTVIFFSCSIGTIESRKETLSGTAEALFQSNDNRSGVAKITVTSGNAKGPTDPVTITIGASGLSSLSLTASPPVLSVGGGASTLRVTAYDETLNTLANIPVTLSTNAGRLNSSGNVLTTNASGVAKDLLTTTETAEVTVVSGGVDAGTTVHVETNEGPTAAFVYSPTTPKVDEKVNFNASGSTDQDGTIVSFQWDFGDGHRGSGQTVAHQFGDAGTFAVVLVVQDNSGNRDSTNQAVSVSEGEGPSASFVYSPANPAENETIYFNASQSNDEDGTIVSFDWDFGDGTTGKGQTITHRYGSGGSYTVLLRVTDDDGNIDTASQTVSVGDNESPVASFFFTPSNPVVNQEIQFNATDSHDPDGTIEEYRWEMGDGAALYGSIITHQYSSNGTYTVYLRVTDNSDNIGSTSKPITVNNNQSPIASFVYSPKSPEINSPVHFNASESTDPDGTIEKYQWDFGDGKSVSSSKKEVDHTYLDTGTFTVVLVVTDDSGNTDSVSTTLTVIDGSPIAFFTISPNNPEVNDTVTFDASSSSDPNGRIVKWLWDFGDSSATGSTVVITHKYNTADTYTVTLTVTDNDDNTATISQTVTVTNI